MKHLNKKIHVDPPQTSTSKHTNIGVLCTAHTASRATPSDKKRIFTRSIHARRPKCLMDHRNVVDVNGNKHTILSVHRLARYSLQNDRLNRVRTAAHYNRNDDTAVRYLTVASASDVSICCLNALLVS
jgi:hypothetical protein